MAQYIDKSVLVAEIDRRLADNKKEIERASHKNLEDYFEGYEDALTLFKDQYLDTLEVKEMDLEKEIDKFYGMYRKNGKTYSTEDNEECLDWKVDCNPNFEKSFAKHFFELGMQISNKTLKGE